MDHVPPRSLFPVNLATDIEMVTAPACHKCHNYSQKDDTTTRNLLISTAAAEGESAVARGLAGKRDRSLTRGQTDIQKILEMISQVNVETPAGIYLGKKWAFDFDSPTMERFVERLARALLWYEFRQVHFKGAFTWRMNPELPNEVYEGIMRFGRLRMVHEVFAYGLTRMKKSRPAWIIANFYGSTEFVIRVARTEPFDGVGQQGSASFPI